MNQDSTRLSDGAKALHLVLDQQSWTHRRVESLAFEPGGETRRRISWDLTVPQEWAIEAGRDRIAVPITTLRKVPLKRLDVRDKAGASLALWGREANGELAVKLLTAGLQAAGREDITDEMSEAIEEIVFASCADEVADTLALVLDGLARSDDDAGDLTRAVEALARALADGFLLVVELPGDAVGARSIVKLSYDDDELAATSSVVDAFSGRAHINVEARGWREAASWHLEVHAPVGLKVDRLEYEVWEEGQDAVVDGAVDVGRSSTAHVTGMGASRGVEWGVRLVLAPARPGLINQAAFGSLFVFVILLVAAIEAGGIAERLAAPGQGRALAAVALGLPAFLLALLARGPEHHLVSRVLMAPRLVSLGSALSLWAAGVLMLWTADGGYLQVGLGYLATGQLFVVLWIMTIRSVGGQAYRAHLAGSVGLQ